MSALNDDLGGKLNLLVGVPRAMSPAEAREFLITGAFPDLSRPAPEEGVRPDVELSETEARLWLGTLTAASDALVELVFARKPVKTGQTGTEIEPLSSSQRTDQAPAVVDQLGETELV